MDRYQASHQPQFHCLERLFILTPPISFLMCPWPNSLLWLTCSLPRHKALSLFQGTTLHSLCLSSKETLSQLNKAFIRPVLSYASPVWFPFLCETPKNILKFIYRSACRVISGRLASTANTLPKTEKVVRRPKRPLCCLLVEVTWQRSKTANLRRGPTVGSLRKSSESPSIGKGRVAPLP